MSWDPVFRPLLNPLQALLSTTLFLIELCGKLHVFGKRVARECLKQHKEIF